MPAVRDPVRPRSRTQRVSGTQRRTAPLPPSVPAVPVPAFIDPPSVPFVEGEFSEEAPAEIGVGAPCLGCEIGNATAMGSGPGGNGEAGSGDLVRVGGLIREPVKLRNVTPLIEAMDTARAAGAERLGLLTERDQPSSRNTRNP